MLRRMIINVLLVTVLGSEFNEDLKPQTRIVGGQETNIEKFPHQISLEYNKKHSCGGAIISRNYVITAAHCIEYVAKNYIYNYHAAFYWLFTLLERFLHCKFNATI